MKHFTFLVQFLFIIKLSADTNHCGSFNTDLQYLASVINVNKFICGGIIIHPKYVLTAAHCTYSLLAEDLFVRAGIKMVNTGGQLRQVVEIFEHENFDNKSKSNDIAILRLTQSFDLDAYVQIVDLATKNFDILSNLQGMSVGWNDESKNGSGMISLWLYPVTVLTNDTCQNTYNFKLEKNQFCAQYSRASDYQTRNCKFFVCENMVLAVTTYQESDFAYNINVFTEMWPFLDFIYFIVEN